MSGSRRPAGEPTAGPTVGPAGEPAGEPAVGPAGEPAAGPAAAGPVVDAESRPRAVRIGLTGPIGCGKSTVAAWLAARGAAVIDADAAAHAVSAPGEPAHAAILDRFGDAVRGPDGTLDRAALARIVFADPAALRDLEAIVHPAVRPRILAAIDEADAAGVPAIVIEAIKLVEGGLAALCDEVWLVACGPATQRGRLAGRGLAGSDAERRIAAQDDPGRRLRPFATRVLEADGSPAETEARAAAFLELALAAGGAAGGSAGDVASGSPGGTAGDTAGGPAGGATGRPPRGGA